jgi:hypothetical protein
MLYIDSAEIVTEAGFDKSVALEVTVKVIVVCCEDKSITLGVKVPVASGETVISLD